MLFENANYFIRKSPLTVFYLVYNKRCDFHAEESFYDLDRAIQYAQTTTTNAAIEMAQYNKKRWGL